MKSSILRFHVILLAIFVTGGEETAKLLVVRYPDESQAEAACQSFSEGYLPDAKRSGAARVENKKWMLGRRHQNFVAVVFEAASKERAESLFAAVRFPAK
ncbi:MAG: hypothetical protein QHH14_05695 [Clostridiales bacterium]|jgi:hypothetical protein|nr:hypothetical protein [Clostridiales bacterium]